MSERELVKLVEIDAISPIDGADAIELITVGGWNVVAQKGLYSVGDGAFYFEIDSLLPLDNPAFEFLATRGVKEVDGKRYHRLKTIKLRGQISQGLLVPWSEFGGIYYDWSEEASHRAASFVDPVDEPYSFAEALGILKYDDVVVANAGNADTAGSFPTKYGQKTDAERVQNLKKYWDQIKTIDWYASEKIDGCSLSVFRDEDGNFRVCSRNWEVKDGANIYWNTVRQYQSTFDTLPPGFGIQAEIYGQGIQGNRLGLNGKYIAVFNYLYNGRPLEVQNWPQHIYKLAAPTYDLELPDTVEEAIEQANGIKSNISKDRLAEGIVWTNPEGFAPSFLGRHCFKVVSTKYLLKFDG